MSQQDADMWRYEFERVQAELNDAQSIHDSKTSELAALQSKYDDAIRQAAMSGQDAEMWRFEFERVQTEL